MEKETENKESIKVFRDDLVKLSFDNCKGGYVYRSLAYATAAIQLSGADSQTQKLYEILYWAHAQIGNYHESKTYFNMALGYDQLNEKYLRDYSYYYKLPTLSIISLGEISLQKIIYKKGDIQLDNPKSDWLIFIPEGYRLDKYALVIAMKIAKDNGKNCVTFSGKGVWGIERKLYEKLQKKGVTDFVSAADGLTQYIHCSAAKII